MVSPYAKRELTLADFIPKLPSQDRLLIILATSLVLAAIVILLRKFRVSSSRGNSLLLVGPSDGGKTAIMSTLVYGQTLPSHTSLQTNASYLTFAPGRKPVKVVDVPGHPRVRGQFKEYLDSARAIAFVVDSSTISRNGDVVAEHLHLILHELMSLPPSHPLPSLLVLAHKSDLLKGSATTDSATVAINRVKTILERELEKRRQNQTSGVNIEGLGEEDADRSEWGGLECSGAKGVFHFEDWEGGEVTFLSTFVRPGEQINEKNTGIVSLSGWLEENL